MQLFKTLSAKARLAVVAMVALAGVGALAVPPAYASAVSQPKAPAIQVVPVLVSAAASSSGCAGIPEARADHNHENLTLWYQKLANHKICVGTVRTTSYPPKGTCVNPQVRIYSGGTKTKFVGVNPDGSKVWVCNNSKIKTYYWPTWPHGPSHSEWSGSVQVVGSSEMRGGHGELGPASITLNN